MDDRTDEQIMTLVIKGDEKAFGIIVRRYLPKALAYAESFLRYEDSGEAVQEAFLRMWKYAYKWKASKGKVYSWFNRILTNVCLTYAVRSNKIITVELIDDIYTKKNNMEDRISEKENNFFLYNSINKLKKREQNVLILKYYNELSNKDIANIMDTTVKAVESILVRTLKKLRKKFKEYDHE